MTLYELLDIGEYSYDVNFKEIMVIVDIGNEYFNEEKTLNNFFLEVNDLFMKSSVISMRKLHQILNSFII
ncbi:hypothetical protein KSI01_20440 [Kurthia sibirica]|uniref:Uncharacterized protein n=1 Tax=Kurthia sibirica TaxID=202750 RepID=A0A2U3AJE5_9BACL|nr:hypothetical protein DEX24_11940 [Kurthia sibirica]GEK34511.1 hypothetical protein KSI01_20440 [Kurthia sibirica]